MALGEVTDGQGCCQWDCSGGWDLPVGLGDADHPSGEASGCSALADGCGTRWDFWLNCSPARLLPRARLQRGFHPRPPPAGVCADKPGRGVRGKSEDIIPIRKREESELLFFSFFII